MRKLIPVLLAVVGIGAGGAIGFVMKPAEEPHETAKGGHAEETASESEHAAAPRIEAERPTKATDSEYMPLTRKLIVPFRRENGSKAFLALDVSLEVAPGEVAHAKSHEPKVVDAFLRVLIAFAATRRSTVPL